MKIVAVTQRVDTYSDRGEKRDALDQRLTQWLAAAGYLAVPVPNGFVPAAHPVGTGLALSDWIAALRPSAIVLSGGNDLGEATERDETELELLQHARARSLPVLGICHGMQVMAAYAGTGLIPLAGHVRVRHAVFGERSGEVNSFHKYAPASCPDGFAVTATAGDGCIEAIRHLQLPWEGWMWHPEREATFKAQEIRWIQSLFGE